MRISYKLSIFIVCAVTYFTFIPILRILLLGNFLYYRKLVSYLTQFYSKFLLWVWNVQVRYREFPLDDNYLIVGNHLSYLDILVIASQIPTCFVTSEEIRKTPFLGQICELAGCVFVNRKSKSNIENEIIDMTQTLRFGINVLFFPEATSTDGSFVLNFKRPLFSASLKTKKNVLPLVINYESINNTRISGTTKNLIFWYGDMPFFSHFLSFLSLQLVSVNLDWISPINSEGLTADDLAVISRSQISNLYNPIQNMSYS